VGPRWASCTKARVPLISLLVLGVVHVPLPQADYHNIRHHDGSGEVCVYHDHLLRWHPTANVNDDVSLLHWHWFVPPGELGDPSHPAGDVPQGTASGPAVHAHLPSCLAPNWPGELVSGMDGRAAAHEYVALTLSAKHSTFFGDEIALLGLAPPRFGAVGCHEGATLRAERTAMFQRWNC
jgi:hypothetical protein